MPDETGVKDRRRPPIIRMFAASMRWKIIEAANSAHVYGIGIESCGMRIAVSYPSKKALYVMNAYIALALQ